MRMKMTTMTRKVTLVETDNEEAFDDGPVSGTYMRLGRQSILSLRYLSSD